MMVLRQLFAIAVLPFTVTVVVPGWLARRYGVDLRFDSSLAGVLSVIAGCLVLAAGIGLFAASLRRFATDGKGTLAPWDPPRRLVVTGVYRHVRNPMITGVVLVLAGEALLLRSPAHAAWVLTFLAFNAVFIPLLEEPQLAARFGEEYREYCRNVPRLVPRWRAWPGKS
jgi:protein-S-isoprenylcysteine O-methyltransferase Ste14